VPGKPYVLVCAEGPRVGVVIVVAGFSRFCWLELRPAEQDVELIFGAATCRRSEHLTPVSRRSFSRTGDCLETAR
jgi:hypothetical protein